MRTLIVTQDEPFYIPQLLSGVLAKYDKFIGIITLPGTPYGFTTLSYYKRLYEIFGLRESLLFGLLFLRLKLLDLLNRLRLLKRSYSVLGAANNNYVPVFKLKDVNSPESLDFIKNLNPEVIVSVAAPQIFKKRLLDIPRYIINIHAALLPNFRGMMPSFWVLAYGEKCTGVTVHFVNAGIDNGGIILQIPIEITNEDTLHSLQTKVSKIGAVTLLEALNLLDIETIPVTPNSAGSYFSFPNKEAVKKFRAKRRRFI